MDDIKTSDMDAPWEDSLIIAFRDTQWRLHLNHEKGNKLPPPLLKFDGNAETMSADAVTSNNSRFFLFEFKRSESAIESDIVKPMWSLFDLLIKHEGSAQVFLEISDACHHFAYAKKITPIGDKKNIPVELRSTGYYAAIKHKSTRDTDKAVKVEKLDNIPQTMAPEIKSLPLIELMEDASKGVSFEQMCLYLQTLAKVVGEGSGAPIKCVVASSDGFIWPVATLSTFKWLGHIFGEVVEQKPATQNLASELTKFSDFIKGAKANSAIAKAEDIKLKPKGPGK